MSYILLLREYPQGGNLILFLLFVTWAGDTGAYFTGTWIGKKPLAPTISPKKTVEGAVGSVISSVAVAGLCQLLFLNTFDLISCALMGFGVNILNQFGDLAESMIKRDAEQKDSANVVPGFGGVLDIIDSPLVAASLAYLFFMCSSR